MPKHTRESPEIYPKKMDVFVFDAGSVKVGPANIHWSCS